MLRLARHEDYFAAYGLVEKFFRQTQYGHLSLDEVRVKSLITDFLETDQNRVTLLWERDGVPVGILAGQAQEIPFLSRKVAVECLWWVDPEERGGPAGKELLDGFEYWAKNVAHADLLQMMCMPDRTGKALDRFYTRRGYKLTELTYTKEL